jgi:hypothetical protein
MPLVCVLSFPVLLLSLFNTEWIAGEEIIVTSITIAVSNDEEIIVTCKTIAVSNCFSWFYYDLLIECVCVCVFFQSSVGGTQSASERC